VSRCRRLAGDDPEQRTVLLAGALAAHGLLLAGEGDADEALRTTAEAVALHERSTSVPRAAREADLAFVLYAHARVRLLAGVELPQAAEGITRAARIHRRLAPREPGLVAFHLEDVLDTYERLTGEGEEPGSVTAPHQHP
jgi:hypothetical protein